jgi:hypothetical protein
MWVQLAVGRWKRGKGEKGQVRVAFEMTYDELGMDIMSHSGFKHGIYHLLAGCLITYILGFFEYTIFGLLDGCN